MISINSTDSFLNEIILNYDNKNSIKKCNILNIFICILKCFALTYCINSFNEESLYLVNINRILLYQSIIGLVNYIDYYHDWNEKFIESEDAKIITFYVVSFIVTILCGGLCYWMCYKEAKKVKILFYIYHILYIPIIIFYCFLLSSFFKKDYILCITSIIVTINFSSLLSSIFFYVDNCCIFCLFSL